MYRRVDGSGRSVNTRILLIRTAAESSKRFTCLGEMGMGSGNSIQVTASEQGGVVSEPVMEEARDTSEWACSMSTNQDAFKLDS